MGKFKTVFVACLGLGIAAGAGYYLYKKFLRKDGEDEDDSSAQVKLGNLILSVRVLKKKLTLKLLQMFFRFHLQIISGQLHDKFLRHFLFGTPCTESFPTSL